MNLKYARWLTASAFLVLGTVLLSVGIDWMHDGSAVLGVMVGAVGMGLVVFGIIGVLGASQ